MRNSAVKSEKRNKQKLTSEKIVKIIIRERIRKKSGFWRSSCPPGTSVSAGTSVSDVTPAGGAERTL